MKKSLVFLLLILLIIIILIWYFVCRGPGKKLPPLVLKTASGEETAEFQVHDSLLFEAADLSPRTGYSIQVKREDGLIVAESRLSTDSNGRIPETVLWYDIGIMPCAEASRLKTAITHLGENELVDSDYVGRTYTLRILRDNAIVREAVFHVTREMKRPLLYASDSRGCPKSGFIIGEEDVWVVGKNFPQGSLIRLWAVPASSEWKNANLLEDVTKQYYGELPPLFELKGNDRDFKRFLWPKELGSQGSYDIVAEVVSYPFGIYRESASAPVQNVVAHLSYSGFVIQRRPGAAEPLEMDIAGTVKSAFTFQDTFLPDADVYVGVDPCIQPAFVGKTADVYIVDDKPEAQWLDGTALNDKTNYVETLTVGGICGNCWKTLAWTHPLTVGQYDVVLDFNRNGVYDVGIDLIDSLDPVGFTVAEVRVDTISFNTGGMGTITIYDNAQGANITAPEYASTGHVSKPAALVRGGSYSIQVTFKAVPTMSSAQVWAETALGGLESSSSPKTVNFSAGAGQALFHINSVPNSVGKHEFFWSWKYKNVNGSATPTTDMGRTGKHTVYTVLGTPVAPDSTMLVPWLEILDLACSWASGAAAEEDVCLNVMNNGYGSHYTWDYDCHRLASDFVRLVSTQGISSSQHNWASKGIDIGDMAYQRTKPFEPVGPVHGFASYDWAWHQWSEAVGRQRDPSAAASLTGNWGAYEDDLFTHYEVVSSSSPWPWVANQPGQSSGCEAPAHRYYNSSPTLYSWRGPDH